VRADVITDFICFTLCHPLKTAKNRIIMAKPLINKDFACPKNRSKKVKKMLTSPYCFETLSLHTVTTEQKNRKHMRTKTLLIAVAALAAGILASSAQTYSQNVVGYCTVVLPAGPSYTLLASPFDDGNGNSATNWLDPNNTLPNKSQIATWNGLGYNILTKSLGAWPAAAATTTIPPGSGFFVVLPATQTTPITNTFVGTVIVPSQGSITNVIPTGYSLWGSPIPYSGDLISSANLGNLGSLLTVNKSQIATWNGTGYNIATFSLGSWGAQTANLTVGAGFFVVQKAAYSTNWVQNATY